MIRQFSLIERLRFWTYKIINVMYEKRSTNEIYFKIVIITFILFFFSLGEPAMKHFGCNK